MEPGIGEKDPREEFRAFGARIADSADPQGMYRVAGYRRIRMCHCRVAERPGRLPSPRVVSQIRLCRYAELCLSRVLFLRRVERAHQPPGSFRTRRFPSASGRESWRLLWFERTQLTTTLKDLELREDKQY